MPRQSEELRFWSKVRIAWPDDCWEWQAGTDTAGYGKFKRAGRTVRSHRYALLAAHDMLDTDKHVLHSCDNPPCCNPAHLRLGTNAENVADMVSRGRQLAGEANGYAKLTEPDALKIRQLASGGVMQREIAAAYGVSQQTISDIKLGKLWGHVK